MDHFGFGSTSVNKSSGQFGFDLGQVEFGSIRVITVLDRFGFGSVQFQISGRNRFNSFSCRFGSSFGSFDLGHFFQVYKILTFLVTNRKVPTHQFGKVCLSVEIY